MLFALSVFCLGLVVGCDDSSSASGDNNETSAVESSSSVKDSDSTEESSSSIDKKSSGNETKDKSSSSENMSSSSAKETKNSSDSKSSSSVKSDDSSSSKKDTSSSSVSSSSSVKSSSSSTGKVESSSSSLNGFDWSLPKEAYFNPDIDYGEVTDERDGKVYRTVKIGEQTWMAENLNFDPGQGGSGEDKYDWSWCYNDEPANCDVTGRFYTWAAAIDSVKLANDVDNPQDCGYGRECGLTGKVQGICPSGWHLPSYDEWNALFTAVGGQLSPGKVLKSQTGWNNNGNGTDAYGFSALPAGYSSHGGYFYGGGINVFFWSATEYGSYIAFCIYLSYEDGYANLLSYDKQYYGFSVRCIKDSE